MTDFTSVISEPTGHIVGVNFNIYNLLHLIDKTSTYRMKIWVIQSKIVSSKLLRRVRYHL